MKSKLPESYVRLKKYSLLVEEICKDVNLKGHGFDPGVLFVSDVGLLDLPEWFLKRLYDYVSAQPSAQVDGGMRCAVCGRDQIEGVGCPDILCESHHR